MMNNLVLVVQSDPLVSQRVVESIALDDWHTITVSTGAEGFDAVVANKPWLAIMDETLSDMTGDRLRETIAAEVLNENFPRIIMLRRANSGGGLEVYKEIDRMFPVDMYLSKPFNSAELRSFVNRLSNYTKQEPISAH